MGVKLKEIITAKQIDLKSLKGKKIGIDVSNMLYQFISSIRQPDGTPLMDSRGNVTSHLMGLSTRIPNLIEQGIKLCFILDGVPPELKSQEIKKRAERKEIAKEKLSNAKTAEEKLKFVKQTIKIEDKVMEETKEFLKAMGQPIIQSISEADAQLAYMNQEGDIWACATTDIDCLIHGGPRIIKNLTVSQRKKIKGTYVKVYPEIVELKYTLKKLKINQDQLMALSILVGTDYNPGGVKGIGPKTALKLVQQHKKFDEIFKNVEADFNWKKIYATFKNMPIIKNYQLKWEAPNIAKITKILSEREFSEDRINKIIEKVSEKKQKNLDKWFN
ncbi:MAG: flap endonuclease-1 [Candidatus Woesearchaeota archaeon]